jgi:hypothetical protein
MGHAPENTLAGIEAALKLGADGIEIDVVARPMACPFSSTTTPSTVQRTVPVACTTWR